MKTVFVSILSGVEAKDILRTNILETLLKNNVRVVLFVKNKERVEFYKKEFNHQNLVYEVVPPRMQSSADKIFDALKYYLVRTETLFLHKHVVFLEKRNYLHYAGSIFLSWILGHSLVRRVARFLDYAFINDNVFSSFFDTYKPDLIFLANLFDAIEISFLRESKRRGISSVGFVNSWDKIGSKGFVRMLSDKIIAPNFIIKQEAIDFLEVSEKDIFVSGVPQYDHYISKNVMRREEFFRTINADSKKELIVLAPLGNNYSVSDWEMIDLMRELVLKNAFIKPTELLVRFPPNDFVSKEELEKRPWLRYDLPGTRFTNELGMDWDMSFQELDHLRNLLAHASILVGYSSSISIDAAIFNKPIINVGFTLTECSPLKNPIFRYHTTHYQKALSSGGIRLVKTKHALIKWINNYFENPALDADGRKRLVEEQCGKMDGKTGERMANFLLSQIK